MKYQYILNEELLFETNDTSEFLAYLIDNSVAYNTLYDLLKKADEVICNMETI